MSGKQMVEAGIQIEAGRELGKVVRPLLDDIRRWMANRREAKALSATSPARPTEGRAVPGPYTTHIREI